jgi:hypothetical protein
MVSVASSVASCIGYDSSYFQREAEKKRAAQRLRPSTLGGGRTRAGLGYVALVRAYATRAYAAETMNWAQQFDTLLADANRILEPALGLTLRNAGTSLWSPATGETEPALALKELSNEDTGDGVQWVVGFLQSVPKLVTDYHKLAVGGLCSKYLVLRGSASAAEREYIGKFEGMSETEREKVYSERRRHKIVAVFLHEMGHTLGATHRTARDTLMSAMYDPSEKGYDDTTLGLLKITLPGHLDGTPCVAAPAVVRYLEKDDGGWVGSDRDGWLARLRKVSERSTPQAATTASSAQAATTVSPPLSFGIAAKPATLPATAEPSGTVPLTGLGTPDRALYDSALAKEKAGDVRGAWDAAVSLFEKYPNVLGVQDLRCRLAKERKFVKGVIAAYCERYHSLGGTTPDEGE